MNRKKAKTEIRHLRRQISKLRSHLELLERGLKEHDRKFPLIEDPHDTWIIEADAGTSCNNPTEGYGNGYGSYEIRYNGIKISYAHKIPLGPNHSSNSAEVCILKEAFIHLSQLTEPEISPVLVLGDSRIALNWVKPHNTRQPSTTSHDLFVSEVGLLQELVNTFKSVKGQWRPRGYSVEKFGH